MKSISIATAPYSSQDCCTQESKFGSHNSDILGRTNNIQVAIIVVLFSHNYYYPILAIGCSIASSIFSLMDRMMHYTIPYDDDATASCT